MAKETAIEWTDSTLNLQMGCDGCELWNQKKKICYAGRMIDGEQGGRGYAGMKGWPSSFEEPSLHIERLEPALKWKDLTGTARPEKPWLDGMPRTIFLNDMGDTFSKRLPINWLASLLPRFAESPHQFLLLTKRPSKLLDFSRRFPLPPNVWPGTTITSELTAGRADFIRKISTGGPKFISAEPLWGQLPAHVFAGFQWAIFGGESGTRTDGRGQNQEEATPMNIAWLRDGIDSARLHQARVFVKQLGTNPYVTAPAGSEWLRLHDDHGGDWSEWPLGFQIREMPQCTHQPQLL